MAKLFILSFLVAVAQGAPSAEPQYPLAYQYNPWLTYSYVQPLAYNVFPQVGLQPSINQWSNTTNTTSYNTQLIPSTYGGPVDCNNLENLVNNYRRSKGLPSLTCHDKPRYLARMHVYDLRDADSYCGDLHAWRSNKYTHPHGKCGGGEAWRCKIVAKHQGKSFVLQTRHAGWGAEISMGGKGSDRARFNGWKNSPGHEAIMRTTGNNIFGCFNDPNGEFSHCIFQYLGVEYPYYPACSQYL